MTNEKQNKNMTSHDAFAIMDSASNKKLWAIAYILWFFLGFFGVHRFYLQRTGSAAAMLVIGLVSLLMLAAGLGIPSELSLVFLPFGGIGLAFVSVWWVVDMFLTAGIVKRHNQDLAEKIKQEINQE